MKMLATKEFSLAVSAGTLIGLLVVIPLFTLRQTNIELFYQVLGIIVGVLLGFVFAVVGLIRSKKLFSVAAYASLWDWLFGDWLNYRAASVRTWTAAIHIIVGVTFFLLLKVIDETLIGYIISFPLGFASVDNTILVFIVIGVGAFTGLFVAAGGDWFDYGLQRRDRIGVIISIVAVINFVVLGYGVSVFLFGATGWLAYVVVARFVATLLLHKSNWNNE